MKVKNIFKKNQIIIFALAIMIAVAGYLNFSRDKSNEGEAEEAASSAVGDELFEVDGESFTDISDEDAQVADENTDLDGLLTVNDPISTEGNLALDNEVENKEAALEGTAGEEVAANPDDSAEVAAADGGAVPGEAIFVDTTKISSSYFSNAKLMREQTRARNKENLLLIIQDATLTEEQKNDAIDALEELTSISEKETSTEILLEAKGYSGVVVSIVDDSVDVIVNAPSLTEQDMAIIEDIVLRKTGADAKNIAIANVIMED